MSVPANAAADLPLEAELRAAQQEARAEAARTTAILSQLAEGVIVTDAAGRITFVNEAAARIHGVSELNVAPDDYSRTYHLLTPEGEPFPTEDLPMVRALRGERVDDACWRVGRGDGVQVFTRGSARPLLDADGVQIGAVLTMRDDTAREAAERQVRDSEARLRSLTDNLPGGMVYQVEASLDPPARRFVFVSHSCQEIAGIAAEAAMADAALLYGLIAPEEGPRLADAEAEAIRSGALFDLSVRARRADGEPRWWRIISAPRRQASGTTVWDGLLIDITDEQAAERALRESREHLATAVAIARLGVFEWNYRTQELELDARAREIYGLEATGPVNSRMVFERIDPEDARRVRAELDESERQLSRLETSYWFQLPDGRRRAIISLSDIFAGADGRPERVVGVLADNTERKLLEERLEERVRERTAELERVHEQLRQSQKLESMGQLTGGVAHDFNNLLTPIIGSLDMLQRRQVGTEREQRLIGGALESAERAKTLVQRLLAFARRQPLKTGAVDVAALINGMAELVASTSGPRIEVLVDIAPDLPPAKSDPNQLEMAILNLSVNARDAMPDGGTLTLAAATAEIEAGHRSNLPTGRYVQLTVSDSGVGMDEAVLARAVEPFFSTKGIGKGTGLGLSMVHGLASQLGGAMLISSKVGLGTRVELMLPVAAAGPQADAAAGADAPPAAGASASVLLVDDEELVRTSTAEMLRDLGYQVTEADSARAALERLADERFDVVVTDHLMPGMSGTELARWIAGNGATPVLVISGYAELEGIAPEIPRLTKPFRQDELARSLAAVRR